MQDIENIKFSCLKQLKQILFNYIKKSSIKKNHLKKAIEKQNADVVFLDLTYSYRPKILEHLVMLQESGADLSFLNSIKYIKTMKSKFRVPLIVIFTAMGFEYELFAITIRLPIKRVNDSKKIDF